jgi:hypothetical protein
LTSIENNSFSWTFLRSASKNAPGNWAFQIGRQLAYAGSKSGAIPTTPVAQLAAWN